MMVIPGRTGLKVPQMSEGIQMGPRPNTDFYPLLNACERGVFQRLQGPSIPIERPRAVIQWFSRGGRGDLKDLDCVSRRSGRQTKDDKTEGKVFVYYQGG